MSEQNISVQAPSKTEKPKHMLEPEVIAQLTQALDRNALFLTANTRLASHLRQILDAIAIERAGSAGKANSEQRVWQSASILPFEAWTKNCWDHAMLSAALAPRLLLTPAQDGFYWEQALEQTDITQTLMAPAAAAAQAQQAYQLLRQSLVDPEQHTFEFNSAADSRAFYQWLQEYQKVIDATEHIALVDAQQQLLRIDTIEHRPIVLIGFQSPTPLQQALALHYAGDPSQLESIHLRKACQRISNLGVSDFASEVNAAAQWSKQMQQQNPAARIAVVIQNLSQHKMLVERSFSAVFEPARVYSPEPATLSGFNMSAGVALAETALVSIALFIIDTLAQPLKLEEWTRLLNSAYMSNNNKDFFRRQALLAKMYDAGEAEYNLVDIERLLHWRNKDRQLELDPAQVTDAEAAPVDLTEILSQAAQRQIKMRASAIKSKKQCPSDWLPTLFKQLALFGWPGKRTLSSDEYQQRSSFERHSETFSSFDTIVGKVTLANAIRLFHRHCQNQIYHRETVSKPNMAKHVQVLGGLEASGQTFDHLWLLGMSDRQWPAIPQAHPLIPRRLQIEFQMPSASVEREFEYAKRVTSGYLNSASDIVISYPQSVDDIESHISSLVYNLVSELPNKLAAEKNLNLQQTDLPSLDNSDVFGQHGLAASDTETLFENIADLNGLPLTASVDNTSEAAVLPGGSAMIKDYNVNPLKAYFKWRLGVKPLGNLVLGVSPLERGNSIHEALEAIWQALGGSASLHDCTAEQLRGLVVEASSVAINTVMSRRFIALAPHIISLEQRRLANTLLEWLVIERKRPAFNIYALERALSIELVGQRLNLRIDRIDRLADGQLLLIDYKSGLSSVAAWLDDKVSEPQLPIYVCAIDGDPELNGEAAVAISYARLKADALGFDGIADDETAALTVDGVSSLDKRRNHEFFDWQQLTSHWRENLQTTVEAIVAGRAAVDLSDRGIADPVYEPAMRLSFASVDERVAK